MKIIIGNLSPPQLVALEQLQEKYKLSITTKEKGENTYYSFSSKAPTTGGIINHILNSQESGVFIHFYKPPKAKPSTNKK